MVAVVSDGKLSGRRTRLCRPRLGEVDTRSVQRAPLFIYIDEVHYFNSNLQSTKIVFEA